MGGERESDCRVPVLACLIFISCLAGGLILTLWLLDAKGSQPWFPVLALVLIGFPWLFWALICCYSVNKKCLKGGGGGDGGGGGGGGGRAVSKRMTPQASIGCADLGSRKNGHVIMVEGGGSSIPSDGESERPLNRSSAC